MATVSGGKKMQTFLTETERNMDAARNAAVEVGFQANATYPDGTQVALVAAVQEYGAPSRGIPPRPFFRNMIAANKAKRSRS